MWGAATFEVPRNDATFMPKTLPVSAANALAGGVRGGVTAKADWYSVSLKGAHQSQAILGVLKSGVPTELAEAPFASTTGGSMPAGTLIFPANSAPVLFHGSTTANRRYVVYATNPFSRYDGEREWPLIVQAALWTNLTDE